MDSNEDNIDVMTGTLQDTGKRRGTRGVQNSEARGAAGSGSGCSNGSGGAGVGEYSSSDEVQHESPETPKHKLDIQYNYLPENWWDKLPDFDPRVYDALAMEQAAACVQYIFDGLPDVHELENMIESRKNRKTCTRLKVQVPRTKVLTPKEITYDTTIDTFVRKDQAY